MSELIKIKDLPAMERPRERLITKGASSLSLTEIFEVILERGVVNHPISETVKKLIKKYPHLPDLLDASYEELTSIKGIGMTGAAKILAAVELASRLLDYPVSKKIPVKNSNSVYKLLKSRYIGAKKEYFYVLSLDSRKNLISIDSISVGTISQSLVHPREVFKTAIKRAASYVILSHNHPSGEVTPSIEDIAITKRLKDSAKLIGIPVVDHIIIGNTGYFSFKDNLMIEEYIE